MKEFEENIKNEAPLLFNLKKENSLKVPKGYFEQLPKQLMNIATEESKLKVIKLKNWFIYSTSIAAMLVLGFFIFQNYNQTNEELLAFNQSYKELTAESFQKDFLSDDLSLYIDFDDENIDLLLTELDKPIVKLETFNDDINDLFESDIEYYY